MKVLQPAKVFETQAESKKRCSGNNPVALCCLKKFKAISKVLDKNTATQ